MPQVRLSESFARTATAEPDAERTLFWDEGLSSFALMVTSAGHRSFVVQYRNGVGKSKRLTLKGGLSLKEARREARALLGKVAKGHDPLTERRKKAAEATNSLKAVAEQYLARKAKDLRSIDERRRVLEQLIFPKFGSRPIDSIKRSEINRLLDEIEDERGPVRANYALAILRHMLNWHATRDDDFLSPIVRGMARVKPKDIARSRTMDDDELRKVWRAADATPAPFGPFIQFLLLTGARRTEAAAMTWDEINGDWTLPAARNKTKVDLVRPLSSAAQDVLAKLPRIGRYVFTTDGKTPISGYSKFKAAFDKKCGVADWRLHDLRRTARSLMSRAGVNSDHAERCLGHVIAGVRGVYDRHEFCEEKLRAYEALAAQIERIVNPVENVVALRDSAR